MKIFLPRRAAFVFIYPLISYALWSQETAASYFESVAEQYRRITDYSADLVITKGRDVRTAALQYRKPNLLRLDFSRPKGQVIAVDGKTLRAWVPKQGVTFEQVLRRKERISSPGIASLEGLELMRRYYTVAYAESPLPVPLEPGSSESVVVLRLNWKSNNEGFRRIDLSINANTKMIRRAEGITTSGQRLIFDFTNIVLNRGIPDTRFSYQSPATGSTIENFLFDLED